MSAATDTPARANGRSNGRAKPSRASAQRDAALDQRELLAALRAFRRGDFTARLPRGLEGMDGDIAEAFNEVVELAQRKTMEFARLGEAVGRQGKIEQRAKLPGAMGSWSDKVETVN